MCVLLVTSTSTVFRYSSLSLSLFISAVFVRLFSIRRMLFFSVSVDGRCLDIIITTQLTPMMIYTSIASFDLKPISATARTLFTIVKIACGAHLLRRKIIICSLFSSDLLRMFAHVIFMFSRFQSIHTIRFDSIRFHGASLLTSHSRRSLRFSMWSWLHVFQSLVL